MNSAQPVGHLDIRNLKQVDYFCPHKLRGTPPSQKTLRRFARQGALGMSTFRKEKIDKNGVIRHPTKPQIYGHVASDGRLQYVGR